MHVLSDVEYVALVVDVAGIFFGAKIDGSPLI